MIPCTCRSNQNMGLDSRDWDLVCIGHWQMLTGDLQVALYRESGEIEKQIAAENGICRPNMLLKNMLLLHDADTHLSSIGEPSKTKMFRREDIKLPLPKQLMRREDRWED